MSDLFTLHSGVVTATGSSTTPIYVPDGSAVSVNIVCSAVGGTTPSATFEIQWSNDGTNWASADGTADTFAAITANKAVAKNVSVKGELMRLAWTVSGTTPTFTVAATIAEIRASRR